MIVTYVRRRIVSFISYEAICENLFHGIRLTVRCVQFSAHIEGIIYQVLADTGEHIHAVDYMVNVIMDISLMIL